MDDSGAPSKLAIGATYLLPTTPPSSEGDKPRRMVHSLQYVSDPAPLSKPDDKPMDYVPAYSTPGYLGLDGTSHTTSDACIVR